MGYGISTNLIFGVLLSPEDSTKLYGVISAILAQKDHDMYDWLEENEITMIAEDSDSRIHDTQYEEGFEHGFGVLIADKGYGSSMSSAEFKEAANSDHEVAVERFKQVCQPLLDAAGIKDEPESQTVSYMA